MMNEMVDEFYATMMVKLKALLPQSTSVSLTTDVAKMLTGDSYVAVTGYRFRMGTFVSHVRCEHQQCCSH